MDHNVRETEIWNRSAEKHQREGRPVAACLSTHLVELAQNAREEYKATAVLAQEQHEAAVKKEESAA